MKPVQEVSGRRHSPLSLMDISCDSAAGVYQAKKSRALALRLLSPLVDLLLDCFIALLVEPDDSPGIEVSTFAELAEALVCEDRPVVHAPRPGRPHSRPEYCPSEVGPCHFAAAAVSDSRPEVQLRS